MLVIRGRIHSIVEVEMMNSVEGSITDSRFLNFTYVEKLLSVVSNGSLNIRITNIATDKFPFVAIRTKWKYKDRRIKDGSKISHA